MNMKQRIKLLTILLLVLLVLSGCGKKDDSSQQGFQIKERGDVHEFVQNWVVYPNPAFRFELRSPKNWEIFDVDKKGEEVYFYPRGKNISDDYSGELRILGFSNWKDQLKLEEFITSSKSPVNYYLRCEANDIEKIVFKDFDALWFKNVEIKTDQFINVLAIDAKDRIIIMELYGSYDVLNNIIGSLYFY